MGEDNKKIEELLFRSVDTIYPSREKLREALGQGRKLKLYLGIDPTGPHLHLGHLTNLLVLRRFQELGHQVILLIGDFTAQIGDPTDKLSPRQPLTSKEIKNNFKTFKSQVGKILKLGLGGASVKFNSSWLKKLSLADVIRITQHFTHQQIIERDMFQERLKEKKPIGIHEFLYPLMQGYDSVAMDVDAEVGGTDQTFNMLTGRDLLRIYKNKEKFVITTRLLINPKTGKKLMNKSDGGLINLDDSPQDIFGKVMALDDEAMFAVAEHSSQMPISRVGGLRESVTRGTNPRDAKLEIAHAVVATIYTGSEASRVKEDFVKIFSKGDTSGDIPVMNIGVLAPWSADNLVLKSGVVTSKSAARRLIEGGGFSVNNEKITDPQKHVALHVGDVIKVGKHKYFRIET